MKPLRKGLLAGARRRVASDSAEKPKRPAKPTSLAAVKELAAKASAQAVEVAAAAEVVATASASAASTTVAGGHTLLSQEAIGRKVTRRAPRYDTLESKITKVLADNFKGHFWGGG